MLTKLAVWWLSRQLKKDKGYWESWKANIAMSFKDEWFMYKDKQGVTMHDISNQAAENFLKLLTR